MLSVRFVAVGVGTYRGGAKYVVSSYIWAGSSSLLFRYVFVERIWMIELTPTSIFDTG